MFRKAELKDLPNLFRSFKKYLKTSKESQYAKFETDNDVMDYLNFNLANPQCLVYVAGEKEVLGFVIIFMVMTPFVNIKNRMWLEILWKDKKYKMRDFSKMVKTFLCNVCKEMNAKVIQGMVSYGRKDLERFYKALDCEKFGSIYTLNVMKEA